MVYFIDIWFHPTVTYIFVSLYRGSPLSCHLLEQGGPRTANLALLRPQLIGNPESLMFLNISSYAGGKVRLYQTVPGNMQLLVVSKMPKYHKEANMETKHSIFHFLPSNLRC